MNWVAIVLGVFLVGTLLLLAVAMGCNLELQRRVERAGNAAKTARLDARNDRAEAAQLRKSNQMLQAHTEEHCRREVALRALLAAQGWQIIDGQAGDSTDAAGLAFMADEPNFSLEDNRLGAPVNAADHYREAEQRLEQAHTADPEHATYLLAKAQAHATLALAAATALPVRLDGTQP